MHRAAVIPSDGAGRRRPPVIPSDGAGRRRSRGIAAVPKEGRAARRPGRRIENAEVARVLREVADLLDVEGANAFRVRAYRSAARTVEELPEPVASLADGNGASPLRELPGIGADLAGKIAQIARTGTLPMLAELRRSAPPGAAALLRVRGVGPRRARVICETLGVRSLAGLERAARAGRIRTIRGLGAKTEAAILRELEAHREEEHRVLRATAVQYADELVQYLRALPGVERAEVAGSLRRLRETVGDVDVLVSARDRAAVIDAFAAYPGARDVLERGRTRASIRLRSGLQVDLRVVARESFGAALHYFTGSKAHNIAVRAMARGRGLKVNEYGVFHGSRRVGGREEREVFDAVGLPWIPPELREARGELEAAAAGTLPALVGPKDIRGDLQMHTTDSDGRASLDEMADGAQALGYEYIAITDHTPAVRVAGGLDAAGFRHQWRRIDRLNGRLRSLTVLKGVEVDIRPDGSLDLDDATLAGFDIVFASVHSRFDLPREAQTERLLRAIHHPSVSAIAHPTGRLIGRRREADIDFDAICHAAADSGVLLEVNAQPQRLDLDDAACRHAVGSGVRLVIDTDAHSVDELAFMRWGVDQARRGWVERAHVGNTRHLSGLLSLLRNGAR